MKAPAFCHVAYLRCYHERSYELAPLQVTFVKVRAYHTRKMDKKHDHISLY